MLQALIAVPPNNGLSYCGERGSSACTAWPILQHYVQKTCKLICATGAAHPLRFQFWPLWLLAFANFEYCVCVELLSDGVGGAVVVPHHGMVNY